MVMKKENAQKRRRGRPQKIVAAVPVDPASISPAAILAAIAADPRSPVTARVAAAKALILGGGAGDRDSGLGDLRARVSAKAIELLGKSSRRLN